MTDSLGPQLDVAKVAAAIAKELDCPPQRVRSAIDLLVDGNTIPFIARYRKEATGGLDEIALRAIEAALEKAQTLAGRKATVLKTIAAQGALDDRLRAEIENCTDLQALELLYLPFKPKRRTRATIARERGLQPLADLLLAQKPLDGSAEQLLGRFVAADKDVPDRDAALAGALDIVAEQWSEQAPTRTWLVKQGFRQGQIASTVKRGKKDQAEKFEQYIDRRENARRIPSHRLLAMLRGEAEGVLKVSLELPDEQLLGELKPQLVPSRDCAFRRELLDTVDDCYNRLLVPATQSAVLQQLKEQADEEAIAVFGKNLRELLMAPPAGPRVTMGIDPGFRTGCKVAVVDGTGRFVDNATIYPTPPKSDTAAAARTLLKLIDKHGVELIAIGNGTASRETDAFVAGLLRDNKLSLTKAMVSEAGASVYSASELAAKEFPDLDVTVRGAISIARRLQDPLAELVKTDPKSIGVGQYQHDVNQRALRKCLEQTVESCVNSVGVDLNTASAPLLSQVAGIGPKIAENIVAYRDSNGRFENRRQLTKVAKLGKKAFEQAAGFLRIRGGDEPLDNSAVHPESYSIVARMARQLDTDTRALVGNATLSQKLNAESFVEGRFGLPTIRDILSELAKPGRDPRSEFRAVRFDDAVNEIGDLRSGMVLEGVITNVTHFGAFIDLGVHQDGLIHISQLADRFVSDPSEIVSVGDIVRVKVMEVDTARKRISVTRKF
ncbi:Tex family protein [Roseimaritima sediminicola]|uniref:Tex family protein n=1 Tax=Roseimaritima sediminicola TaxID=2662066 RepID=UPI001298279A|nr:Tex family protein [Roseimaritima sediminicola]